MWKDFLNFSKRERITIIALTFIILLAQLLLWTKDSWVRFLPKDVEQEYLRKKELEAYRDSVTAQKPMYASQKQSFNKKSKDVPIKLVPFNPNTADSMTLRRLGLRAYVVKNILNYRRKGGSFRKPADFSKIYGMEPEVFTQLEPYIQLEGQNGNETTVRAAGTLSSTEGGNDLKHGNSNHQTSISAQEINQTATGEKRTEFTSTQGSSQTFPQTSSNSSESPDRINQNFDLNSADTTLLQQLKGVGSITANRISRYRNQLGGFYSMSQLSEIKGLYPETLTRLQSMLKIDPNRINMLDVNKASLEKLRAHPYLSFYQAKVIVELRKARGSLRSLDELSKFEEFKPTDLERLKWYLRF